MNESIWTISTLNLSHETRTWGYEFSREEAVIALNRYCDSECGYYTYAVIELFEPGIYQIAKTEIWFKWEDKWVECKKPDALDHVVNFGLG